MLTIAEYRIGSYTLLTFSPYFSINDDLRVLVADFGLARDTDRSTYYKMQTNIDMPVPWMAVESLNSGLFTAKTDVVGMQNVKRVGYQGPLASCQKYSAPFQ